MTQIDFFGPIADQASGKETLEDRIRRDFRVFVEQCVRSEDTLQLAKLQDFQHRVCDILLKDCKPESGVIPEKLIILPRGFGKSVLVTMAYVAWRIGNDPELRIIIASATEDQAIKHLNGVESIFREPQYIKTFGHMVPDGNSKLTWSATERVVAKRIYYNRIPTLKAVGVGSNKATGMRCDLLLIDDIITQQHASSPADRSNAWDFVENTLSPMISPEGRDPVMLIVNTRYHVEDLAGRKKKQHENQPEGADEFTVLDIPSLVRDENGNEQSIWPTRFPTLALQRRREINYYSFMANYMNDPINMENVRLGDLDFIIESEFDKIKHECQYYMGIDPNTDKQSMKKDFFAAIIVGVHPKLKLAYIVDLLYSKKELTEIRQQFLAMNERWRPTKIYLEDNAAQGLYATILQDDRLTLPIHRVTETEKKEDRIIRMSELFLKQRVRLLGFTDESGRLQPISRLDPFRREWVGFPEDSESHFDALDAAERVLSRVIGNMGQAALTAVNPTVYNDRIAREKALRRNQEQQEALKDDMVRNIWLAEHTVQIPTVPEEERTEGRLCTMCKDVLPFDREYERCTPCNIKQLNKMSSWQRLNMKPATAILGTIQGEQAWVDFGRPGEPSPGYELEVTKEIIDSIRSS